MAISEELPTATLQVNVRLFFHLSSNSEWAVCIALCHSGGVGGGGGGGGVGGCCMFSPFITGNHVSTSAIFTVDVCLILKITDGIPLMGSTRNVEQISYGVMSVKLGISCETPI